MADNEIRSRFSELCDHLKERYNTLGFLQENFSSETSILTIENGGLNETTQGWHFANFRYIGTIYIEQLPASNIPLLALLIRAWLDEFDDLRNDFDLLDPTIEIIEIDATNVKAIIKVDFIDDAYLVETVDGRIPFDGKVYDISPPAIKYAESGTVNGAAI